MSSRSRHPLSRRTFLRTAGVGLASWAGSAIACNLGGRAATDTLPATSPSVPRPAPSATPFATATAIPSATPVPTAPAELAADLLLHHGKIITVDPTETIAQAVAVKGGRIVAVGADADLYATVGERTQLVDLGGRAVTPGLIDAHNHLQVMGLLHYAYVPLLPPEVRSLNDLQAKLAEAVAQTQPGEWIQAYFLVVNEGRLPDRHDLDAVAPQNPVWVVQQGGHYGSANSLALQIAGVTAATPDPIGGVIERDARGEPTGVFYNHRAMDMLRKSAPRPPADAVHQYAAYAQPVFAQCGVTSFQDNNVRGVETVASYLEVGRDRELSLRGAIYYTLEWPSDLDRALYEMEPYPDDSSLRFAGFKFLLDGQPKMAYCHAPHNGVRWDLPTWEPQSFKEAVRALHDTGLQICVHCVGDAAVDLTLDAVEEAMDANPRPDPRHRIEHCVLTTPQATQRIKELGVVVCTQPQFIRVGGDAYVALFGEERGRRAIVTREWLDAGIHLALGSDAPTTPWYTPQVTLAAAMTRYTFSDQQLGPEQVLTIQEALRAHTMGAAYAAHEESDKGSIEVGKLADLAVWAEDPYSTPPRQLWQSPIEMTLVGGAVVHQSEAASLLPHRAGEPRG